MRYLICTQPIIGHVEPGLVIAGALRERGHEVAWYTGSAVAARVRRDGFRVFGVTRAFDYDGADPNQFFPEREGKTGLADIKFILKHVFAAGMPLQVEDLAEILKEFPADVLVADFVTFGPRIVSERMGVPWASFGVSALALSSVDTAPYGLGILPGQGAAARLRNRILGWLVKRVIMADVVRHFDAQRRTLGRPALDAGPTDTTLSPYLFLQGSVSEFEYPRSDLPPQVHFVGALTPAPKKASWEPPPWWGEVTEKRRPVVLVTQGTMDNKDLGELIRPALQGLAAEDILVIVTTGRDVGPEELGPLPPNARVARFVPYHELLPHADVMVSNGGYNGVLIALSNGVPLVVTGSQSDKPEICARVAWSCAGVRLKGERAAPSAVCGAVREVLSAPGFRARARALAELFQREQGGPASAALLEELGTTRAPVLRSGAANPLSARAVPSGA